ncbi:MAG: hypothetical protein ACR2LI_08195 [Propionibacteriaceae bacterium]
MALLVLGGTAWLDAQVARSATTRSTPATGDAMIDLTRRPGQARDGARALAESTAHPVLVFSGNVDVDHRRPGQHQPTPSLAPFAACPGAGLTIAPAETSTP